MPLPLIGIGVATVGGVGTLIAARKMMKDKKRYDCRRSCYKSHYKNYKGLIGEVNADIWNLHLQRVAASETLREAADFLVRANVKDRSWNANSGITAEQFAELKDVVTALGNIAASATGAAVGGAVAGATAAAGVYATVAAFGTASTGAAISGLSGIAARNATLAWLGGGSLASGGGGIAAGMATLLNVVLAPLAILPAVVMGFKAKQQSERIREAISEMDIAEAEMDRHGAELTTVQSRTAEVSKAVVEAKQALKNILRTVWPTRFRQFQQALKRIVRRDSLEDVHRVYLAAKALAELLNLDADSKQLPAP